MTSEIDALRARITQLEAELEEMDRVHVETIRRVAVAENAAKLARAHAEHYKQLLGMWMGQPYRHPDEVDEEEVSQCP